MLFLTILHYPTLSHFKLLFYLKLFSIILEYITSKYFKWINLHYVSLLCYSLL
jgi:hypothetical protein